VSLRTSGGLTKNRKNALHVPLPEQKMFHRRTEPTLFRAGTVPETVPVRSLMFMVILSNYYQCYYLSGISGNIRMLYERGQAHFNVEENSVLLTLLLGQLQRRVALDRSFLVSDNAVPHAGDEK